MIANSLIEQGRDKPAGQKVFFPLGVRSEDYTSELDEFTTNRWKKFTKDNDNRTRTHLDDYRWQYSLHK